MPAKTPTAKTAPETTPGPWEVIPNLGNPWEVRDPATSEVIAESRPTVVGMAQACANARLIASSPDYYAATEEIARFAEHFSNEHPEVLTDKNASVPIPQQLLATLIEAHVKAQTEATT